MIWRREGEVLIPLERLGSLTARKPGMWPDL